MPAVVNDGFGASGAVEKLVPDSAGAYRYDYPVLRYADAYLPSFSLEAVHVFLDIPKAEVVVDIGSSIVLTCA